MRDPVLDRSQELRGSQVVIVGLGLMGGSLAGALRGQCRRVIGVARREETIETALDRGLIDQGTTDVFRGVRAADVVILATPVRVILRLLGDIGPFLPTECVLMDLGSTKAQVVARMAELPEHVQPFGGHPMCGKEISGIAAADPELYRGCTFILTPLPRTSQAALSLGHTLAQIVGAYPLVLNASRHDKLVATASHLPYVLACALVGAAENLAADDPTVWDICASGFRDTSRLAASDVTMMLDILLSNRREVLEALDACERQLSDLVRLVKCSDEQELRPLLTDICRRRREMLS